MPLPSLDVEARDGVVRDRLDRRHPLAVERRAAEALQASQVGVQHRVQLAVLQARTTHRVRSASAKKRCKRSRLAHRPALSSLSCRHAQHTGCPQLRPRSAASVPGWRTGPRLARCPVSATPHSSTKGALGVCFSQPREMSTFFVLPLPLLSGNNHMHLDKTALNEGAARHPVPRSRGRSSLKSCRRCAAAHPAACAMPYASPIL